MLDLGGQEGDQAGLDTENSQLSRLAFPLSATTRRCSAWETSGSDLSGSSSCQTHTRRPTVAIGCLAPCRGGGPRMIQPGFSAHDRAALATPLCRMVRGRENNFLI